MSVSEPVDVVIVGARCAGAATALLLARQGHRVLVLDRARKGSDTLSTHALMRGGVVQLDRWGLLEHIIAAGTPPIRETTFHYGDDSKRLSLKPAGGVDALYAPRRTVLDRVLVDAAIAAGAEVRFGVTVTGLDRADDGRVTGVACRNGPLVRSRLTIGADGVRSLVAREVDAVPVRTGTGSGAVVYGHWAGLAVDGYEWFYRPGATAGLIPTNDGEVCVFAGTSSPRFHDEIREDIRAGYLRLLKEVTGDRLPPDEAPTLLRAYPGRPGYVRRPWGPGWALVGDAGYYVDPLSTHGMTDSLRDAALLADSVDAVLGGENEAAALAAYEIRRDLIAGPMFGAVDRIAGYEWTLPSVREALLELSTAMGDEVEALSG